DPPRELGQAVNLGFTLFPAYRLFVIGVTAAVLVALWLFLSRTDLGLVIRAGSRDPLLVQALGLDLRRIRLLAFGIGALLPGLRARRLPLRALPAAHHALPRPLPHQMPGRPVDRISQVLPVRACRSRREGWWRGA